MQKNKIKNGVIALIKGACLRLQLTTREFMRLHEMVRTREDPVLTFVSCCLELEASDSRLRPLLKDPKSEIRYSLAAAHDVAYSMLYHMVDQLYVNDPATFFSRNLKMLVGTDPLHLTLTNAADIADGTTEPDPLNPDTWDLPKRRDVKGTDKIGKSDVTWDMLFGKDNPDPDDNDDPNEAAGVLAVSDVVKEQDRRRQDESFGSEAPVRKFDPVARPDIPWNDGQNKAFKTVFQWYADKRKKPILRMFGFAGTGKTSMAKEIAWVIENGEGVPPGVVMFAAYTGKAASVLQSKGCNGASTIHSLIYKPKIDIDTGQVVGFTRNAESPLTDCALLIVDEVSQVNEEMATDLMSYGVPILVIGDPKQLKPIKGEGYFVQSRPDVMLTAVERTAKDDPITYLATLVREGKRLKPGRYGESRVYAPRSGGPTDNVLLKSDQILVGMRNTRDVMNRRYRIANGKFDIDTQFPVKGDRLMCLKNNKLNGLMNGTVWQCTQPLIKPVRKMIDFRNPKLGMEDTNIEGLHFKVRSYDMFDADGRPLIVNTVCSTHHFDVNLPKPNWRDIAGTDEWGFGYAATTHKGQGSQWDHVVVIDESHVFPDQEQEHLYTAITRAAKSVRVYLPS